MLAKPLPPGHEQDALAADKIVRLVYVDEAGVSNPQQEPRLVVSGVIVDADKKLIALERHLDALVRRFIPEDQRSGFVFRATELFNGGRKVFKRADWPLERRLEIADQLAAVPRKFAIPIVSAEVERATFWTTYREDGASDGQHVVAAQCRAYFYCAVQIELWMRSHAPGEVCLMIVEDNPNARAFISRLQAEWQTQDSVDRRLPIDSIHRQYLPFKRIKQRPLFEPKSPSSVLQLADF